MYLHSPVFGATRKKNAKKHRKSWGFVVCPHTAPKLHRRKLPPLQLNKLPKNVWPPRPPCGSETTPRETPPENPSGLTTRPSWKSFSFMKIQVLRTSVLGVHRSVDRWWFLSMFLGIFHPEIWVFPKIGKHPKVDGGL